MSKNLIIKCFFANADMEGKEVVLKDGNTYEVVKSYNIVKNTLIVNDKRIVIKDLYESHDGYLLRMGEYILEAI